MEIRTKRVYSPAAADDGIRVLVDRVWPRGVSKERLHAKLWLKDAAPSTALRKWFDHDPAKWDRFKERYFSELPGKSDVVRRLVALAARDRLTFVFSARNTRHNQAVALKEYLMSMPNDGKTSTASSDA
jgi:uncharacterized protein YeaO (DUF488 family)